MYLDSEDLKELLYLGFSLCAETIWSQKCVKARFACHYFSSCPYAPNIL